MNNSTTVCIADEINNCPGNLDDPIELDCPAYSQEMSDAYCNEIIERRKAHVHTIDCIKNEININSIVFGNDKICARIEN